MLVWPRVTVLRAAPYDRCHQPAIAGGMVDRPGDEGDLVSARPYRPGDSPRRIHWAHTSRRDVLIVSERQTASQRRATVAIDSRAFPRMLDAALRVVASVCQALHRHGWQVVCELNGQPIRISSQPAALRSLWDRLAMIGFDDDSATAADSAWSRSGKMNSESRGDQDRSTNGSRAVGNAHGLRIIVTNEAKWRARLGEAAGGSNAAARWIVIAAADDSAVDSAVAAATDSADDAKNAADVAASLLEFDRVAAESPEGVWGNREVNRSEAVSDGVQPWIRVTLGSEGEDDWRRQWERRCHGDESCE
jgi:hypothetical protein